MDTNTTKTTIEPTQEQKDKMTALTLESMKSCVSTASKIYNLFCNSDLSSTEKNVEKWKKFEHDMIKLIYEGLGETNPPDEVCNLTAFINAFSMSLVQTASLEAELTKMKNKKSFVTK